MGQFKSIPIAQPEADTDARSVESDSRPVKSVGKKSIAFFAGLCLVTNNTTGAGMVQIPAMFQQCGWLYPILAFALCGCISTWAALFLSKAVARIPGNANLEKRIEFNELTRNYMPRWMYLVCMTALLFNFQASNISSIILSAQVTDSTLLAAAKMTCAIVIYPPQSPPYECITRDTDSIISDSPFGDKYVATLGLLISAVIALPLGMINLEDNMFVQIGSFVLLIVCEIIWAVQFFYSGLQPQLMPAVQSNGGFALFGPAFATVVFNYGFVTTIPSWLNEKKAGVSVPKTIVSSVVISFVLFVGLGLLGALSLQYPNGLDLLAAIMDPATPNILMSSLIACYIFPYVACLSGIPVFSIIIRYNLINEGVPLIPANLFAVVLPWALSLFFYAGDQLALVISWSSAVLFVFLNFCLPLITFIRQSNHMDAAVGVNGQAMSDTMYRPAILEPPVSDFSESLLGSLQSAEPNSSKISVSLLGSLQSAEPNASLLGSIQSAEYPDHVGEDELCCDEPTVENSLSVVPPMPCLKEQPSAMRVAKWLLVLCTGLAIACLVMQIAQEFVN